MARKHGLLVALALVAGLGWMFAAAGCNTVKGAGEDVSGAAQTTQDAIHGD